MSAQRKVLWTAAGCVTVVGLLLTGVFLGLHYRALSGRASRYSHRVSESRKMKRLKSMVFGVGTLSVVAPAAVAQAVPAAILAEDQLPRVMMTAAYPLNQSIANLPKDTRSLKSGNPYTPKPIADIFYQTFGPNHLQFNTTMPITVVDTRKTPDLMVPVKITTNWGSDDASHVPVTGCRVEGGPGADPNSDLHCIIFDTATGILHETFVTKIAGGQYTAAAYRRWNTNKNEHGKPGQNSADAAGLPILPLLLRYSEASTGPVNHALRFTISNSRNNSNGGPFTLPASHAAGQNWGSTAYMGMRLRLRPDFDASSYSQMNQNIVLTLKNYGLVLADNGISGLVVADDDPRWNQDDLTKLGGSLTLNDFIPVNSGPIIDSTVARRSNSDRPKAPAIIRSMLRTLIHNDHAEIDSDGFRLRGLGFSRLDGFSDVVFGFALTLLVVSLEVPKSFEELHHLWGAFLPFGISFLLLMLIWYGHFTFFRRFGTHDAGTVWLNGVLLFVVLFYVYPLKFLFLSAFGLAGALGSKRDMTEIVLLFSVGLATLYFLFAALYANAYRQRVKLALTPLECFLTRNFIVEEAGTGCFGLLVAALAILLPPGYAGVSCLAFLLISAWKSVMGARAGRTSRKMREAELQTLQLGADDAGANTASMMNE